MVLLRLIYYRVRHASKFEGVGPADCVGQVECAQHAGVATEQRPLLQAHLLFKQFELSLLLAQLLLLPLDLTVTVLELLLLKAKIDQRDL